MKTYSIDKVKDKILGKRGSENRELYEAELEIELLGLEIKRIRKELNLTQSELGEKIGVKKAQISRLESNTGNVNVLTLLRVFKALGRELTFNIHTC
jgi:DNA-binding XRE family transcriptional regulator